MYDSVKSSHNNILQMLDITSEVVGLASLSLDMYDGFIKMRRVKRLLL